MSRLADYFIVVGYDDEKERSGISRGKILQRFPEREWEDCPFTQGVELFCQPEGWSLSSQRQRPSFYVAVLTDIDAERHYLATLTFHERVSMLPTKVDDEDADEGDGALVHHSLMFAPKTLALISRLDYFEAFRNCLGIIYTVHVENLQVQLETLVGNILGCVQVPPPGGPQVRFSIGAGDRQALQPALSTTLPVTHNTASQLFDLLGINNTLTVVCAALTDHKILFHSESYSRLTDACHAVTALHYPFKYSYVYIPILPAALLEVLSTPTPFIAGIHSSLLMDLPDLLDVIVVDLDGGSVHVPECVSLARLPDRVLARTKQSIRLLLDPELQLADCAFPPSPGRPPPPPQRDKDIRAVFLRMFCELLTGYRSCLTIIRIHPEPFITFYKANFLGHHGMVEDDFLVRLLDSMSFSHFVMERGPPFRTTDVFDEVYASLPEQLRQERGNVEKIMEHIRDLSHQLYTNENPNPQPYVQKVPRPTEGAHARIHQPPFPFLDEAAIKALIEEGLAKHSIKTKLVGVRPQQPRVVPLGPGLSFAADRYRLVENNARRLEVLRNCVTFIFENRISDARIIFPAVLRALNSREARLALTQELSYHVQSNRAMLENQQFDLVVKLLNCALQHDSYMDENGVAAAILPLATAFCRKLCTGVIQFVYTCVQEHAVWGNLQFWEQAFYQDVQRQIRQLYLPQYEEHAHSEKSPASVSEGQRSVPGASMPYRPREIGALEIAAEQMRVWPGLTAEQQAECVSNEESTVYSQAIHYANRMVYLRVPLDCSKTLRTTSALDGESNSNSNVTASIAESDSYDAESGFDESEATDVGATVVKFVTRFVDKVCNEGKVTQDHIKSLHQMIPGVVAMHIETLEAVNKESKRLPPIQKPKILVPALLAGEEIVMEGLRVYLLSDGREEGTGGNLGGPSLLPAEGAIFLTTYRLVFKGTPCDPLACDLTVIRGFPVSTLTKEKKMTMQSLPQIEQTLTEGLQLRSNVFQLMKIAFDEEVGSENIDTFRKLAHKVRNPSCVQSTFAFTGHLAQTITPLHKQKEKNASLRQFAKRTLLKTARKAGLKSKSTGRKTKYVLPTPPSSRRNVSPRSSDSESDRPASEIYDDLSIIDESEFLTSRSSDPRNIQRLMEYPGYHDYERLGFGALSTAGQKSRNEPFRITLVNASYSVCRSYPALLVVPQTVTDESIRKFARCHRQSRLPVITWRHPRTKALLLRASGFHSRGLMGMLRHNPATGTSSGETSSGLEQEKYFSAVVAATPSRASTQAGYHDSFTSLDSLLMSGATDPLHIPDTPDALRRTPPATVLKGAPAASRSSFPAGNSSSRAKPTSSMTNPQARKMGGTIVHTVNRLRASMGKGRSACSLNRIGSLREKGRLDGTRMGARQNGGLDPRGDLINTSVAGLARVALYVLGEKNQMKGIKAESFPRCDFIPVDFYEVRHVKASFKKLMRACVPSSPPTADTALHHAVQDSEWLLQVQSLLQLAGAAVDLLDSQGSSVLVCLEDGWDITTQVTSVAQVCLDPHYRTVEGFRALVEKEWLQFGHRFTHRSNQTAANQASGFAPIFLQFLDAVHQIHQQFPLQFEFNQYYLRFLAYHAVSNRFRTFMLDSEWERVEGGWLEERRPRGLDSGDSELGLPPSRTGVATSSSGSGSLGHSQGAGASVWDYIDKHHRRAPVFFNYLYSPEDQEQVLRPYSGLAALKVWNYFLSEDLAHGPSYDLELVARERQQSEESESEGGGPAMRRIVNACYHNVPLCQPDFFTAQFQEIRRLETELGHLPQTWRAVWDRLETGPRGDMAQRPTSFTTQMLRSQGRSAHKRSTLEILVRGKMLGEAARALNQPHRFERYNFTTPAYCDYCSQVLWGLSKTGMHCADCGYNCHEKCTPHVPKNCSRLKPVSDTSTASSTVSRTTVSETSAVSSGGSTAPPFEHFTASLGEHRTHEGYLYKQGALLKGWKQRWFVLDSMKHQLRYYDAMEDSACKGYIDLAEVESVQAVKHLPGAPKKAEENSFFEIHTVRRNYNFMATDAKSAHDWVDKLQSCIQ